MSLGGRDARVESTMSEGRLVHAIAEVSFIMHAWKTLACKITAKSTVGARWTLFSFGEHSRYFRREKLCYTIYTGGSRRIVQTNASAKRMLQERGRDLLKREDHVYNKDNTRFIFPL